MSLWKVIVLVSLVSLALFVGALVYALYPEIRNVSGKPELLPFVDKDLRLRKDVYFYKIDEGRYRFEPLLMSPDRNYPYEKRLVLPEGSSIRIEKFKTYKGAGKTAITELYALGSARSPGGKTLRFEYDWGNVSHGGQLKPAPWQDSSDKPVIFHLPGSASPGD